MTTYPWIHTFSVDDVASIVVIVTILFIFGIGVMDCIRDKRYDQIGVLAGLLGGGLFLQGLLQASSMPIALKSPLIANVFTIFFLAVLNLFVVVNTSFVLRKHPVRRVSLRDLFYAVFFLLVGYESALARCGVRDSVSGIISHSHFDALYLTVITWTTVGFGDVLPVGHWGRFFAALAAVNGYCILALLVGMLVPKFLRALERDY